MGYFNNIGRTKRQGLDLGLSGTVNKLTLSGSYSYVKATYDSSFDLQGAANSSGDDPGDEDSKITVNKGNYIPGIPKHQFKLRLDYNILPSWNVGTNINVFSDRFMMGNENNEHVDSGVNKGKTPGYTVVNLDTNYQIASGWSLFGKINNLFDKDYTNGGRMGQSILDSSGATASAEHNVSFVAPGAPRAGWIGVRYEFGGADKKD
jgi:outer membrane receptor protein involved in Fe transport